MNELINSGWLFQKTKLDVETDALRADGWRAVQLPHDWLIWQADDLYEDGEGWYKRSLTVDGLNGWHWLLRFDGVYMDCGVYVNGALVCEHKYGYTAFDCDMTERLRPGDNELLVRVRHHSPNSRWYSGAGIFRDVTLVKLPDGHIVPDGVYTSVEETENGFRLILTTEMERFYSETLGEIGTLRHVLTDANGEPAAQTCQPAKAGSVTTTMEILSPERWDCAHPVLYRLTTTLISDGEVLQEVSQNIGFRTLTLTTDRGLLLNGNPLKLNGVCLHHDLGLLGAAYHESASRRQLLIMRDMGVNALRTSHNPPAKQVMDLCDELGLLVIDEAFDMWEMAKTTYDYARFFPDWSERDVRSWIRRDRCHPCLLMWSIGNEIYDTHAGPHGQELVRRLRDWVWQSDPRHNAPVTFGSNYMPYPPTQRCADILKLVGYNYAEKYYERHHLAHPDWILYGSETSSVVSSRGVYHFPIEAEILAEDDLQCSALGNSTTSWGARSYQQCAMDDLNTPFSLGQFLWSGTDYIGEPTPYHTRSSYFGLVDTAGFPKDAFYFFRAVWRGARETPLVHIGVCWDFNDGQLIDVPVYSNLCEVELELNGRVLGRQRLDLTDLKRCSALWKVPYEAGRLIARGYDEKGKLCAQDVQVSFGEAVSLEAHACVVRGSECLTDADTLTDGDIAFITLTARDADGNPVRSANNRVNVEVKGAGVLLGLDNGDSADTDAYKSPSRCLFSGMLLAMVGGALEGRGDGEVLIRCASKGLTDACLSLRVVPRADGKPAARFDGVAPSAGGADDTLRVRKIALHTRDARLLTPEQPECVVTAETLPRDAIGGEIQWRVVNAAGVDSSCASVTAEGSRAVVRALGDGAFYLRAACNNGFAHPRVLSQLELSARGFGEPTLDPYGFVAGSLYTLSEGSAGAGNDHGVATAREERTMVGYTNLDFGAIGSDEITLPIFTLNDDAYDLAIGLGDPREGGELLGKYVYQKKSVWNTYQPETYRLPRRLTGLQTLTLTTWNKMHIKGFSFKRPAKAFAALSALDCDSVYGDSFTRTARGIEHIGNNVSLRFGGMDFGGAERVLLEVNGYTPLDKNTIQIRMRNDAGAEMVQLAEFAGGAETRRFPVSTLPGICDVTFVFLPGSQFSFYGFQFTPENAPRA